ncbi:MAG: type II toxin-antitoxin system VapC family toxin [bacterium]
MTRLLIDTSAYSFLLKGHSGVRDILQTIEAVFVSPVLIGEVLSGAKHTDKSHKYEDDLRRFLSSPRITVADIDAETARCYAAIISGLRKAGEPVPVNDAWIAASAMQHGLPVLTSDAHFERIPQIRVEMFSPR